MAHRLGVQYVATRDRWNGARDGLPTYRRWRVVDGDEPYGDQWAERAVKANGLTKREAQEMAARLNAKATSPAPASAEQ